MPVYFLKEYFDGVLQTAIMADEKLPARISHRLFATSRSEKRIIMKRHNFYNRPYNITVMNMSGIYKKQPDFIKKLKGCGAAFIDAENMRGTDCYCDDEAQRNLKVMMKNHSAGGVHFIDGGNYHYLSKLWLDFIDEPFDLIVFDNHPDMQSPAFGDVLSCGSWVKDVAAGLSVGDNSFSRENIRNMNIAVIGVNDEYVTRQMKDMGVDFLTARELEKFGDDGVRKWLENFLAGGRPVYISVDKDVLCREECMTNWDQGSMKTSVLLEMLEKIFKTAKVIGLDVCGELDARGEIESGGIYNEKNEKINIRILEFVNKKNCQGC